MLSRRTIEKLQALLAKRGQEVSYEQAAEMAAKYIGFFSALLKNDQPTYDKS